MPLMPKRVKFRKSQRGSRKGIASTGNRIAFGEYGLQALDRAWVSNVQIEACRVAINRAMKRKEKEKEEQLALANELSRIVLTSSDITEIGQGFAFELKELMPVSWAAISLIERARGFLHFFPLSPKLDSNWELGDSISLDDTPVAWLAGNKKALVESDLKQGSRFWTGAYWLKHGIRAIVYMPLFSGGEVFGSLIVASNHPRAYGDRELKLLKYAAGQLAAPVRHSEQFLRHSPLGPREGRPER